MTPGWHENCQPGDCRRPGAFRGSGRRKKRWTSTGKCLDVRHRAAKEQVGMVNVAVRADIDIVSHSAEQTRRLGTHLGTLLRAGDLVLLEGEFGSGKTTFAQGIARGLGLDARYVNSPTFTLINEYRGGRLPLAHIDLYRLDDEEQIATLGLE